MFSKYAWVVPLKDKRGIAIVNAFQKIISIGSEVESKGRRKLNKIWVDQGGEFYNKLFKRFLKIDNIEMYSTYNEGKSVVTEWFIRTLKNKSFKDMSAVSKNIYLDVLDDIVNKYNNTVHRMKPINVTSDSYAEYNENSNVTKSKFKVGDHFRISKHKKNVLAKGFMQKWSKEVFVISKIKNRVPWTYVISDLNGEGIAQSFYEKELQKKKKKSKWIQNRKDN